MTVVNKTERKQTLMFMIEFVQGGLKYFSTEYQSDLRDNIIELEIVNREINNIVYGLYEKSNSISQFIGELEIYLIQIVHNKRTINSFDDSIQIVKELNGKLAVKDLSKTVNYSERQLNRIYNEHHYYDQAHFIKAFKNICGVTPKIFSENMSDFYNEKLKF